MAKKNNSATLEQVQRELRKRFNLPQPTAAEKTEFKRLFGGSSAKKKKTRKKNKR